MLRRSTRLAAIKSNDHNNNNIDNDNHSVEGKQPKATKAPIRQKNINKKSKAQAINHSIEEKIEITAQTLNNESNDIDTSVNVALPFSSSSILLIPLITDNQTLLADWNLISQAPYQYNLHLTLYNHIKELISAQDNEENNSLLKLCLYNWSQYHPLQSFYWIEWANLEADASTALQLYQLAVKDYWSYDVFNNYLSCAIEVLYPRDVSFSQPISADPNLLRLREIFDYSLNTFCYHMTHAAKLFNIIIKSEMKLFNDIVLFKQKNKTAINEDDEELNQQMLRIQSLFQSILIRPINGLEQIIQQYKDWLRKQGEEDKVSYAGIINNRAERQAFEKQLSTANYSQTNSNTEGTISQDELLIFYNYIQFETSQYNNNLSSQEQVIILLERLIEKAFLQPQAWLFYLHFLTNTHKRLDLAYDTAYRAVKNCDNSIELWRELFYIAQLYKLPTNAMTQLYNNIQTLFAQHKPNELNLFEWNIFYTNYLKRLGEFEEASLIFKQAADLIKYTNNPNQWTETHYISGFINWAAYEGLIRKNNNSMRSILQHYLYALYPLPYNILFRYIQLEVQLGHYKQARNLFKKAWQDYSDQYPTNQIYNDWYQFEVLYGNINDLQAVSSSFNEKQLQATISNIQFQQAAAAQSQLNKINSKRKRTHPQPNSNTGNHEAAQGMDNASITPITQNNAQNQNVSDSHVNKHIKSNVSNANSTNSNKSDSSSTGDAQHSIFIKNLPKLAKEELEQLLRTTAQQYNPIQSIQLLNNNQAVIVFPTAAQAQLALELNGKVLNDQALSVIPSDPAKKKNKTHHNKAPGARDASNSHFAAPTKFAHKKPKQHISIAQLIPRNLAVSNAASGSNAAADAPPNSNTNLTNDQFRAQLGLK
jgi:hypothetical protein